MNSFEALKYGKSEFLKQFKELIINTTIAIYHQKGELFLKATYGGLLILFLKGF